MESKAKLLGHPIHQMLIPFPLGLLATSVVFDVMHLATGRPTWAEVAFYLVAAGILSGAAAAIFGWIDWTGIPPRTRAKRVGLAHGVGNALVLLLFAGSWLIRRADPQNPATMAVVLSIAGALLSLVTAWLGGELVDRLGVGVEDGAHVDAPSSLSGRPAGERV